MGQFIGVLYALTVILGGALRFFPIFPPVRALWYLQLVVTELGLVLAIPLAIMTVLAAKRKGGFSWLSLVAPAALTLAILPVLETIAQERNWVWDLQYGPGRDQKPDPQANSPYVGDLARPLFQFMDFFHLPAHPSAMAEEFQIPGGDKLPILIYQTPVGKGGLPRPWVMSIHGGGWSTGSPRDFDRTIPSLLESGYTVISPGYRFSPSSTWPRQQEDIENA